MTTDRELQERVLSALEFEPSVNASQIGVTAHDGVVTLRGSVPTFFEKSIADRTAGRVYGVRAIANDIEVLLSQDARRTDSAIAEAAANTLLWDSAVPAKAVKVEVQDGWVTLSGHVDWRYQREAAETALRHLYGVKGLTNLILVKPRVLTADVKAKIEDAFTRSAHVDAANVHVEVQDGQVTLGGVVRSLQERREAERAVWSAPGVTLVDNRVSVVP